MLRSITSIFERWVNMQLAALALALCAALAVAKHTADDPYDQTFLRHRSFKRVDQIRSHAPLNHIVDGRASSYVM